MVLQFNGLYGTDVSDIENWHKLCIALNSEPLPETVADCKAVSISGCTITISG
jgi:hypothetical protein